MNYKNRDKRNVLAIDGEALNTNVAELQRKIYNLRNQISNYFP
jgi:outer membrane murein-binding lipoprotein Lpp